MIEVSGFRPAGWLTGAHAQTVFASVIRPRPPINTVRERLELPDGDFIDLDWYGQRHDGPVVIILHGLTGSIQSKYLRGLMLALNRIGMRSVCMHFRGASEEPNRHDRCYHSGDTVDLDYLVKHLGEREPGTDLAVVGYSLGGNVLLKWLGENQNPRVKTAVAVSVPFDLRICAESIDRGFSRLYQYRLIREMKRAFALKFKTRKPPFDYPDLSKLNNFFTYDDAIVAPLNGFESALDYYARCSSRSFLKSIRIPTLIIQAEDDPFMSPDVLPQNEELSDTVTLELSRHGGHVGFVAADTYYRPVYWLEQRIPAHLSSYLSCDECPAGYPVTGAERAG